METVLIKKFNRVADDGDINFTYFRKWLEANDLLESKMFVCWTKGKIPINAYTGGNAQVTNPSTWATFDTCLAYKQYHPTTIKGVGIVFGLDSHGRGVVGIDLDHIDEVNSWDLTNDVLDSIKGYKEISQSGTGIHIICFGKLPTGFRKKAEIEMYDTGRFFALTGIRIQQQEDLEKIEAQDNAIAEIHQKYLGGGASAPIYSVITEKKKKIDPKEIDDRKILSVMFNSINGTKLSKLYGGTWVGDYESQSQADYNLCSSLAYFTRKNIVQMDRLFRASGLMRDKWDRVQAGSTYGEITMSKAISACNFVYDPNYSSKGSTDTPVEEEAGEQEEEAPIALDFDLNDTGNASKFIVESNGEIKFNYTRGKWMFWDGVVWQYDMKGAPQIKRMFNIFGKNMKKEMFEEKEEILQKLKRKNMERLFSNAGKKAILEEAQCLLDAPTDDTKFDVQDDLFNTSTGVVDLRSGKVLDHKKEYMFTQVAKAFPEKIDCPKWKQFLHETFLEGDIPFIKKAIGQTLFGNNKSQKFILLVGPGSDGKTAFLNIISTLLGDYAHSIYMNNLSEGNFDKDQSRIFAQEGKTRMLIGNEMKTGKKLDVALIKSIIGGGKIQGRLLYAETFEFDPMFTLWMSSNVKPIVNDESDGFWRRCAIVTCPFQKLGDKINPNIEKELIEEEGGAILNWMLEGAQEFAANETLELTDTMKSDLEVYREEMSMVQRFIGECAEEIEKSWDYATSLYQGFAKWCRMTNHIEPMSQTMFGKLMSERYSKRRTKTGFVYDGIMLKTTMAAAMND